jgi:hypothetical protein
MLRIGDENWVILNKAFQAESYKRIMGRRGIVEDWTVTSPRSEPVSPKSSNPTGIQCFDDDTNWIGQSNQHFVVDLTMNQPFLFRGISWNGSLTVLIFCKYRCGNNRIVSI